MLSNRMVKQGVITWDVDIPKGRLDWEMLEGAPAVFAFQLVVELLSSCTAPVQRLDVH